MKKIQNKLTTEEVKISFEEAKAKGLSLILWPKTPEDADGYAQWTTPYGTSLIIDGIWDWVVFGDVWINREYSFQVQQGTKPVVYDFGANVGYFSLYAADRFKGMGLKDYEIYAFEADPVTFATLKERTAKEPNIKLINGAIGLKEGTAIIAHSANHGTSLVVNGTEDYPAKYKVPYIDLTNPLFPKPDLIKCDIEGSEYDLIENYPELIRDCPLTFMEIHYPDDAHRIYEFMRDCGLKCHTIRQHGGTVTEVFYK